jgi:hypothetical protein
MSRWILMCAREHMGPFFMNAKVRDAGYMTICILCPVMAGTG